MLNKKNFFLLLTFLSIADFVSAGIIERFKNIKVERENFPFFLYNQKPDRAVAFLLEYSDSKAGTNRQRIENELKKNNILFFRCYYSNAVGAVYKYVDISVKGIPLKEVALIDPLLQTIEVQQFYQNGALLSRTQYSMAKQRAQGDNKIYDSAWHQDNPNLIKNGLQEMYHKNGNVRFGRVWQSGQIKDTTYTEFYSNGKTKFITGFKAGALIKKIKFDEEGKPIAGNKIYDNNKKAFLFGLDKYSPPKGEEIAANGMKIPDLQGCVNDIKLLKKTLMTYHGFKAENIFILSDDNASKQNVSAAINQFNANLNKDDIVFIHFSSASVKTPALNKQGSFELAIPCRDVYKDSAITAKGFLLQSELEPFFNKVKKNIGTKGQLILSLDILYGGMLLDNAGAEEKNDVKVASRGESNKLLYDLIKEPGAPTIVFTAATGNEFSMESKVGDTSYGAFTYAFCKELAKPLMTDPYDIKEAVSANLKLKTVKQTPQVFSPDNQVVFENPEETISAEGKATLPSVSAKGNAFVLSIGISDYPKNNLDLRFNNSDDDALSYNDYFTKQFDYFKDNKSKHAVQSLLLQNKGATKQNIIDGIYRAINGTKPEDYFVFNFSGYCKPLTDSNGKQVTYFIPYGLKSITDSIEIIKNGIALKELKDLFQLIPANNQLFITEAGSTEDFQKEFIQALIETSPTIASLSNKNRIFLVPKSSGLDNFTCQNVIVEHGPINYYLTNLNPDLNIYGLFNGGIYADAVRFALNKTEVNCQFFRTGYFDIFFEKDFVKDIKNYFPDDVLQSRGNELLKKNKAVISSAISNRYALVVGTDKYLGKPNWSDLPNPILDAREITNELRDVYGFKVKPLFDASADSVYYYILKYASILKPTDQFIIYFAGHGDFDDLLFDDGFIVCNNSLPAANDPYRNSYIQYSKLSRMVNKLPAQQVLMILDVCFGGSFNERVIKNNAGGLIESRIARNETNSQSELYKDLNSENYFSLKMKKKTRLYISSGPESVPDGYKGKHSPFAFRLLEALQTKGGDQKMLTAGDLYQYVKKLPSGPLMGSFGDDVQGSEFILLAK